MSEEIFEDPEMIKAFVEEASEIVGSLEADLIKLENSPEDLDLLNRIFRGFHTIKGMAGFLGLDRLVEVTHAAETTLDKLRKGEEKVTPEITDAILDALDTTKRLIDEVRISPISEESAEEPDETHVRPELQQLPSLEIHTVRTDVKRLDELMNLVGELVIERNRLLQISKTGDDDLQDVAARIDLITSQLQMAALRMRMQPIATIFNRYPRIVRDLARDMGKEVELIISGEETELDKSIIEEINDPLVHLLRNAVDHGIEPPEERESLGKPRKGRISLSAYHVANTIVIEIQDDGRGIDPDKIAQKAIEKGIITEERLREMSERDVINLIFTPGFSTSDEINNVSGRGVGMDVVKNNVKRLGGMVEVESSVGQGTKIQIKLPLTLAISQSLLVMSGEEVYAIPLTSVIETIKVSPDDVRLIGGREMIYLRGEILPILKLKEIFGAEGGKPNGEYVIIIGLAEMRIGLAVDRVLGEEEVVIKSLGSFLGSIPGIAGATVMGDGRVALIIDVPSLINAV